MNAPRSSNLHVEPFGSALGAVIHGVDLAQPLNEPTFALIRQAFADYGVIFFRDQHLTPEQHLAFARRWRLAHRSQLRHRAGDGLVAARTRSAPQGR